MIDTELKSLSLSRSDWRSLPAGYLRRRFTPVIVVALLCLCFSAMHMIDGMNQLRPAEVRKGIRALALLLIPAVLGYLSYVELLIDMKILKITAPRDGSKDGGKTDVR
jgi:hypothetical protein